MKLVRPCHACAAPVTIKMVRCPHCGATNLRGLVARAAGWAATFAGGVAVSSTLAACYGGPCAMPEDPECKIPEAVPTCQMVSISPLVDDADGDGYCKAQDCNENDKTINAAAVDVPRDGIDQNCDGKDAQ